MEFSISESQTFTLYLYLIIFIYYIRHVKVEPSIFAASTQKKTVATPNTHTHSLFWRPQHHTARSAATHCTV